MTTDRQSAPTWLRATNRELAILEEPRLTPAERRWVEDLEADEIDDAAYLAKLMQQRRERSRMAKLERVGTTGSSAMNENDRVRWRVLSELAYRQASNRSDVEAFRRLVGASVAVDEVTQWVERTAKRDGQVDRTTPLLAYPGRGQVVTCAVNPSGTLARLRDLSQLLCDCYGWQPDQAVVFLVADAIPILSIIRTTPWRNDVRGHRIVIDVDPEVDPDLVVREFRRARAELLGAPFQPARAMTLECTLAAVDRVGAWPSAWRAWKRDHPEHPFVDWRAFRVAAIDGLRLLARSRPWVKDLELDLLRRR